MVGHYLVARQWLEVIVMGECHDCGARRRRRIRTDIEVHRHVLRRSRPRAVQRKIPFYARLFFILGLPNAERERRVAVLAIPVVTENLGTLACPEKIPMLTPGNVTARRVPSVLTSQLFARYVAVPRLTSSGFRGRSSVCRISSVPGMFSGASQKGSHLYFS